MLSYKRIMKLLKGYKRIYVLAMICAVFAVTFYLARPVIFKITIDSVIDNKELDAKGIYLYIINALGGVPALKQNVWICGVAIVTTIGLYCTFLFCRERLASVSSERVAKNLKDNLYNHIQRMPFDYHVKAKSGDLIQRCTSDVETIRRFLSSQLITIVRILLTVLISGYVMFTTNIKMSMVAFAITPVLFLFSYIFFKQIKTNFKKSDEAEGELSTVLQENLTAVRVVRAFGRQKYELDKFSQKNNTLAKLNTRLVTLLAWYWSLSDLIIYSQICAVLLFGINMVNNGEMTVGTMIMFTSYEGAILWPIRQLGRVLSDFGKMQISVERVYEILDAKEEPDDENAQRPSLKGDIVFENVSFEYDTDKPVLSNVSFKIKNGETVAVLGTTGSGKSSLMLLLLRLYDYKSGSVRINGVELNKINKKWLRENIGIVLQEPFLYSKTIAENIRMADFNATDDDIKQAAETACAHGFITEFEKGYDMPVGEKGVTLSGGQKQRVAIARTLVKQSSILVFDDSLSAVDTETDMRIRSALAKKQKDVTTFIISQRITTLMSADKILVFEDGCLTDIGSHSELVQREGLYSRIWNIQNMLEEDFDKEAV